jgi:hypothetical protein
MFFRHAQSSWLHVGTNAPADLCPSSQARELQAQHTTSCIHLSLDTQGHFRYTLLQKVDSHHHGADAQEMPCDDAYGKKVFTIRKALLKAVHYKWRSLIHLITSAWSTGVMS